MRAFLSVLILVSVSLSAPVPKKSVPSNPKLPTFSTNKLEGKFRLSWAYSTWYMHFSREGYTRTDTTLGSHLWNGTYSYDPIERILSVSEKELNADNWYVWQVILDKDNKGKASVSVPHVHEVDISFTQVD